MLLGVLLFITFFALYGAAVFAWWASRAAIEARRVAKALASTIDPLRGVATTTMLVEPSAAGGRFGALFRAESFPAGPGNRLLFSKGGFTLLTAGMVLAGVIAGSRLAGIVGDLAQPVAAVALGAMPYVYRRKESAKRLAAIEEQFPEALDFLARSVKAGNAFSIALELLAAELGEPLKTELLRLTREMALGAGLEEALRGFIARIPLFEVRFFVAAVLLQRQTGGNLSEILGKLAFSVRERLQLRGQVRAASGQGRLTARVLTGLPIATLIVLKLLSPAYMDGMTDDALGRNLLGTAVVSQILGYLIMQQIIKIEV